MRNQISDCSILFSPSVKHLVLYLLVFFANTGSKILHMSTECKYRDVLERAR